MSGRAADFLDERAPCFLLPAAVRLTSSYCTNPFSFETHDVADPDVVLDRCPG